MSSGYLKRGARGRLVCPLFFGFLKRKLDLSVLNIYSLSSDYLERDPSGGLVCPQCSLLHVRRVPAEDLSVFNVVYPMQEECQRKTFLSFTTKYFVVSGTLTSDVTFAFYQHIPHNNITVFTYDPVRIFIQTTFCVIH